MDKFLWELADILGSASSQSNSSIYDELISLSERYPAFGRLIKEINLSKNLGFPQGNTYPHHNKEDKS